MLSSKIALAALGASLAVPAAAQAQNVAFVNVPVAVNGCSVDTTSIDAGLPYLGGTGVSLSRLNLDFVNRANVAATSVTFKIEDGGTTQLVSDRGTFTPGARIQHEFDGAGLNGATCEVTAVDFADGSAWHEFKGLASR